MLPGDVFSWTSHIVVIVGQVRKGSKAYVTVEETPHVLKYGVVYYAGASSADIEYGKKIASEANTLIGGIPSGKETPHVYCMNNVGHYTEEEEVEVTDKKGKGKHKKKAKKNVDVSIVDNGLSLLTSAIESTEESTEQETETARAKQTMHSTAEQAATIARDAQVKRLIIGHFSARYEDEAHLLQEAQSIFPETILAQENMNITL